MPFKSEAQRRKFAQMVREGKLDQKTFDEWEKGTAKSLPERAPGRTLKTGIRRPHYTKKVK